MTIVPTVDALVAPIGDGARLVTGGLPLWRKPMSAIRAIAANGKRSLTYSSFLASLDAELLVAAGCLAELEYGYVGHDIAGASRFMSTAGGFVRTTRSEFEYWTAIRTRSVRYDACLLPATLADPDGNIFAAPLDVMEEDDRLLAECADTLLITVERQTVHIPSDAVLLFPAEAVTRLAVCPGAARPLGMAGAYPPALDDLGDVGSIDAYAARSS